MDIIFDIDNCIADDRARIPLIDHAAPADRRWTAYHAGCNLDPAANLIVLAAAITLIRHDDGRILFHTGRPEFVRGQTEWWLNKHVEMQGLQWELRMRPPAREAECTVALKRWQLGQARRAGRRPVMAFDDREDIVAMYREENVAGIRLAIHGDMSPHADMKVAHPGKPDDWADVDALAALRPQRDLPSVPDVLRDAAGTFQERNAAYGDAWRGLGGVLRAMWPEGLRLGSEEEFGRFALLVMGVGKLHRYARSFASGHIDSARDAAVYAAMLEVMTRGAHGEPLEPRRG